MYTPPRPVSLAEQWHGRSAVVLSVCVSRVQVLAFSQTWVISHFCEESGLDLTPHYLRQNLGFVKIGRLCSFPNV